MKKISIKKIWAALKGKFCQHEKEIWIVDYSVVEGHKLETTEEMLHFVMQKGLREKRSYYEKN